MSIVSPVQPSKKAKRPLGLFVWPKGNVCFAYFGNFLGLFWPHLGHSGSSKWAKLVCLDVLIAVITLLQPAQPKEILYLGQFSLFKKNHILAYFCFFVCQFWSPWAIFSSILTMKKTQNGLLIFPLLCSNLVYPFHQK